MLLLLLWTIVTCSLDLCTFLHQFAISGNLDVGASLLCEPLAPDIWPIYDEVCPGFLAEDAVACREGCRRRMACDVARDVWGVL